MMGLMVAIIELKDDDRAFMLDLYKNYYSLVRKTIYSLTHDNTDLEDLIDDVFIKLIEKISLIRTFDSCKTTSYVVFTTRSVSINYIKHKKVQQKHMYYSDDVDATDKLANIEDDSDTMLVRQEELDLLRIALAKLPQREKDLLYFKYVLEMKDEEIAETFGIATNSVRQYLTRARREAKKLIEREEAD